MVTPADRIRWALVGAACVVFGPPLLVVAALHGTLDHARDWWAHRDGR